MVSQHTMTDRIDALLTNRWLAFPIFILFLWFIFWATFTVGQYPMDWIDAGVAWLGTQVGALLPQGWLKDLLVDGIIAGVGSVLVFLPSILILYFFISLMEDSGYMARSALIMERLMRKIGLHGKSFIPIVMGFGCNVPAIMATRGIESRKSRLITIAIIPFMSCAGRLPIFVLFAGAFFPAHPALALLGIYLLGVAMAVISALVLSRFIKDDEVPFEIELPPYRIPKAKAIGRETWEKGREYLEKIATTFLVFSIIIWALGYFPRHEGADKACQQEHSFIGAIGKAVEPAFAPLGFNWKMDVGLLAGIGAKELVISTIGVTYAQGSSVDVSASDTDDTALQAALKADIPLPAAVAFMVFVLLYFPCIATFIAIKNETGAWHWAILLALYTIALAWLCAFAAFHLTSLLL